MLNRGRPPARSGCGLRGRLARFCALVLAVGSFAASGAPLASAHNGELSTVVAAGPYRLVVRALPVAAGTRAASPSGARSAIAGPGHCRFRRRVDLGDGAVRCACAAHTGRPVWPARITCLFRSRTERVASASVSVKSTVRSGSLPARYVPPSLFQEWLFEPWVLLAAAVAAAFFLQGFVRLRRRGRRDHASWGRLALFSRRPRPARVCRSSRRSTSVGDHFLLSAHMLQHVLIGDAAPGSVAPRGPRPAFLLRGPARRCCACLADLRRFTAGRRMASEAEGRADGVGARLRRLAHPRRLRLRGPQPGRARCRARELRCRRTARLEPSDRPGAPRSASHAASVSASPRSCSRWAR